MYHTAWAPTGCWGRCQEARGAPAISWAWRGPRLLVFQNWSILVTNIYLDIRLYQFLHANIFEHSLVSHLFVRIYSDIRSWLWKSVKTSRIFKYSYKFSVWFFIGSCQICENLDIRSYKFCDTNIIGYLFKFSLWFVCPSLKNWNKGKRD